MRRILPLFLIFLFQLFLTLGDNLVRLKLVSKDIVPEKFTKPYLLFLSTILLVVLYFSAKLKNTTQKRQPPKRGEQLFGSLIGLLSIGLFFFLFYGVLKLYPDSAVSSDVMPQLETLWARFSQDIPPYADVPFETYSAYPVYMPLHWLPIGITEWLGIDARWIGYLLLLPAMAIFGRSVIKNTNSLNHQVLAIAITALPIFAFFKYDAFGTSLSLETVITAYYLVLVAGLIERNLILITLGIILVLLSRYTFIFWLPTLAYLFLRKLPFKKNMLMLVAIVASVIVIYIIPFILKDPSIFLKGIAYHQKAVFDEWNGYGNPPISHSMENGLNFAGNLKRAVSGTMKERAQFNRTIQAGMLLMTMALGLIAYHFRLKRMSIYDFSLGMLYVFIMIFFIFSPLTYLYYMMVPMVLAAVLVSDVISDSNTN